MYLAPKPGFAAPIIEPPPIKPPAEVRLIKGETIEVGMFDICLNIFILIFIYTNCIDEKINQSNDYKTVVSEKPEEKKVEKPKDEAKPTSSDLVDLEKYAGELASTAIKAFNDAACAVQDYNKNVISIVESTDADVGSKIWDKCVYKYFLESQVAVAF